MPVAEHTETAETVENPTPSFQEAFEAAKKEHAPAVETAAVETGDESEDEEPEVAAVATEKTGKTVAAKPATETGLISDEEFATLQKTHAEDPAALRKALEGAFTQKTQKLAAERTSLERLKEYQPLIDAYEADATATLTRLAEMNGFELVAKGEARSAVGEKAAEKTTETAGTISDEEKAEFRASLGPDFEYLADALLPAFIKLADRRGLEHAQKAVEAAVDPLRKSTAGLLDKVASEQTDVVMKTFGESHPDWKEHESEMLQLAQKVMPNGMSEVEYLDHLYKAVTRDKWEADREANIEREASGRFKKRVEKMNAGESETRTTATPEAQVRKRPDGPVSFQQAADDARKGIRYED